MTIKPKPEFVKRIEPGFENKVTDQKALEWIQYKEKQLEERALEQLVDDREEEEEFEKKYYIRPQDQIAPIIRPPIDKDLIESRIRSRIIHIDSRDRDQELYPLASSFRINFPTVYHNVRSVLLKSLEFPNTNAVIREGENRIYWILKNDEVTAFPLRSITIPTGTYNATTLVPVVQDLLDQDDLQYRYIVTMDTNTNIFTMKAFRVILNGVPSTQKILLNLQTVAGQSEMIISSQDTSVGPLSAPYPATVYLFDFNASMGGLNDFVFADGNGFPTTNRTDGTIGIELPQDALVTMQNQLVFQVAIEAPFQLIFDDKYRTNYASRLYNIFTGTESGIGPVLLGDIGTDDLSVPLVNHPFEIGDSVTLQHFDRTSKSALAYNQLRPTYLPDIDNLPLTVDSKTTNQFAVNIPGYINGAGFMAKIGDGTIVQSIRESTLNDTIARKIGFDNENSSEIVNQQNPLEPITLKAIQSFEISNIIGYTQQNNTLYIRYNYHGDLNELNVGDSVNLYGIEQIVSGNNRLIVDESKTFSISSKTPALAPNNNIIPQLYYGRQGLLVINFTNQLNSAGITSTQTINIPNIANFKIRLTNTNKIYEATKVIEQQILTSVTFNNTNYRLKFAYDSQFNQYQEPQEMYSELYKSYLTVGDYVELDGIFSRPAIQGSIFQVINVIDPWTFEVDLTADNKGIVLDPATNSQAIVRTTLCKLHFENHGFNVVKDISAYGNPITNSDIIEYTNLNVSSVLSNDAFEDFSLNSSGRIQIGATFQNNIYFSDDYGTSWNTFTAGGGNYKVSAGMELGYFASYILQAVFKVNSTGTTQMATIPTLATSTLITMKYKANHLYILNIFYLTVFDLETETIKFNYTPLSSPVPYTFNGGMILTNDDKILTYQQTQSFFNPPGVVPIYMVKYPEMQKIRVPLQFEGNTICIHFDGTADGMVLGYTLLSTGTSLGPSTLWIQSHIAGTLTDYPVTSFPYFGKEFCVFTSNNQLRGYNYLNPTILFTQPSLTISGTITATKMSDSSHIIVFASDPSGLVYIKRPGNTIIRAKYPIATSLEYLSIRGSECIDNSYIVAQTVTTTNTFAVDSNNNIEIYVPPPAIYTTTGADQLRLASLIIPETYHAILNVDHEFRLYGVQNITGFSTGLLNGILFNIREIVDKNHFVFSYYDRDNLDFIPQIGRLGGSLVRISSKIHGFSYQQQNLINNTVIRNFRLVGEDYAFLCSPTLNTMFNTGDVRDIFAKISLSQPIGTVLFNEYVSYPKNFDDGELPDFGDISLNVRLSDNSLFDFQNLDYSLTLEIQEKDDLLKYSKQATRRLYV